MHKHTRAILLFAGGILFGLGSSEVIHAQMQGLVTKQIFKTDLSNLPGQEANVQSVYYQFLTALDPKLDTGVYVAGDGVSWTGGWTEGALHTGINAAAAVAQHFGATPIANGPLTQKPLYVYPPAETRG